MLQLVGLGLADETDVTVKGLDLIKKAERVYLEAYTSILLVDTAKLVRPNILHYALRYSNAMPNSRRLIMDDQSSWQTARWSNHQATKSWKQRTNPMSSS